MSGNMGRPADAEHPIETVNDFGAAVRYYNKHGVAPELTLCFPPLAGQFFDRDKALRLAAWIVVVLEADEREPADRGPSFEEILEAVRNT